MKKSRITLVATVLAGSMMFSSCIGPFKVTKSMWAWNSGVGSKFVNELVFLALHIIPVYEVVYLADVLVFNTIEFWGAGGGKIASVKEVKGENGNYLVESNKNGYHITNLTENNSMDLLFDETSLTWSVSANGVSAKLMTLVDDQNAIMYLQDGKSMNIELSEAGYMAFRQAVENASYMMAQK
ncbi:MAG: DUF3332 domain-containing protein [Bacteroidales bacterium]